MHPSPIRSSHELVQISSCCLVAIWMVTKPRHVAVQVSCRHLVCRALRAGGDPHLQLGRASACTYIFEDKSSTAECRRRLSSPVLPLRHLAGQLLFNPGSALWVCVLSRRQKCSPCREAWGAEIEPYPCKESRVPGSLLQPLAFQWLGQAGEPAKAPRCQYPQ